MRSRLFPVVPLAIALAVLLGAGGCAGRKRAEPDSPPPIRRVTAPVAFEMLRDNPEELLVVDLREPDEYRGPLGHIHRARNLPLSQLPWRIVELAGYRRQTFLVYCRNDDCGPRGMAILGASGFDNAVLLDGGIESWLRLGFGTVEVQPPAALVVEPPEPLPAESAPIIDPGTAFLRLLDGSLVLAPRRPGELHVPGRIEDGRFVPTGSVEGEGALCREYEREAGHRGHPGWMELANGVFHGDETGRAPQSPYVHGCLDASGRFRPDSRDLVP
jgi:rhodanese-related sulfurtransferase